MITGKELLDVIEKNHLTNRRIFIDPETGVAYTVHREYHAGFSTDSKYRNEDLTELLKKAKIEEGLK